MPPPKPPSAAIKSIGAIPSGMPDFTGGWWLPLYNVREQLILAAVICLVDICESISISKASSNAPSKFIDFKSGAKVKTDIF